MRRISLLIGTSALWLIPSPVWAVFGVFDLVFDPTNYVENAFTAVNTLNTYLKTLVIIEHQVRDLQPLVEFPVAEALVQDFEEMIDLTSHITALIPFDPQAVQGLFDELFPTGPGLEAICWPGGLRRWRARVYPQVRGASLDAMKAQGLINRLLMITRRVSGVMSQIAAVGGSIEGLQAGSQSVTQMVQEVSRLSTMTTTFQRVVSSDYAMAITEKAAQECIAIDIRLDSDYRDAFGVRK